MLISMSTYPDKDTFKGYYDMDEDGTLDQAGHEVISLFDKSVMLPSMKYEHVKNFLLNPSLSSNIRGVVKSTDPMKFVSFKRFGETRQIHINAMDPYYHTPRVGNRQATFSQDGLSFATPDQLDLSQNQLVKDKAISKPIKNSATAGYNVPLYGDLLPDFFDGTDITGGDNGYERAYFKHFLDNGLQVNPNSQKVS